MTLPTSQNDKLWENVGSTELHDLNEVSQVYLDIVKSNFPSFTIDQNSLITRIPDNLLIVKFFPRQEKKNEIGHAISKHSDFIHSIYSGSIQSFVKMRSTEVDNVDVGIQYVFYRIGDKDIFDINIPVVRSELNSFVVNENEIRWITSNKDHAGFITYPKIFPAGDRVAFLEDLPEPPYEIIKAMKETSGVFSMRDKVFRNKVMRIKEFMNIYAPYSKEKSYMEKFAHMMNYYFKTHADDIKTGIDYLCQGIGQEVKEYYISVMESTQPQESINLINDSKLFGLMNNINFRDDKQVSILSDPDIHELYIQGKYDLKFLELEDNPSLYGYAMRHYRLNSTRYTENGIISHSMWLVSSVCSRFVQYRILKDENNKSDNKTFFLKLWLEYSAPSGSGKSHILNAYKELVTEIGNVFIKPHLGFFKPHTQDLPRSSNNIGEQCIGNNGIINILQDEVGGANSRKLTNAKSDWSLEIVDRFREYISMDTKGYSPHSHDIFSYIKDIDSKIEKLTIEKACHKPESNYNRIGFEQRTSISQSIENQIEKLKTARDKCQETTYIFLNILQTSTKGQLKGLFTRKDYQENGTLRRILFMNDENKYINKGTSGYHPDADKSFTEIIIEYLNRSGYANMVENCIQDKEIKSHVIIGSTDEAKETFKQVLEIQDRYLSPRLKDKLPRIEDLIPRVAGILAFPSKINSMHIKAAFYVCIKSMFSVEDVFHRAQENHENPIINNDLQMEKEILINKIKKNHSYNPEKRSIPLSRFMVALGKRPSFNKDDFLQELKHSGRVSEVNGTIRFID